MLSRFMIARSELIFRRVSWQLITPHEESLVCGILHRLKALRQPRLITRSHCVRTPLARLQSLLVARPHRPVLRRLLPTIRMMRMPLHRPRPKAHNASALCPPLVVSCARSLLLSVRLSRNAASPHRMSSGALTSMLRKSKRLPLLQYLSGSPLNPRQRIARRS
eukprot:Rmarinus@m.1411